ncbi:uncharacterized protein F5147DRAFT_649516 [Suillus discolor]|uniref:Uncharacterized protein n=1 Tax=Suillus discolor TaxID=1912936 RepID=A0A9P7FEA7_9AGAM|nr:uncharacterized protein F5147DRAFT_649516 [Suillus discolor]KAG2115090.1 hypothetical protein F5147DRAFT_649516 [Suillus discolor]
MDDLLLQYHNLVNDGEETAFLDNEEDLVERPCGGHRNTLDFTWGTSCFRKSRLIGREWCRHCSPRTLAGRSAKNFARELRDGTAYIGKCLDQVATIAMLNMCQADLKSWISQQIA